jgi:glycosyltransferase involved in cell wall biosynthesis
MYLHAADACVLPFDEGVTLSRSSLAAAATHRLPIITTKGERLATPFLERQNVLLCPPKDPESLAAAIESVIQNLALRQRLSEGATQLANECFSWEKALDKTILTFRACHS